MIKKLLASKSIRALCKKLGIKPIKVILCVGDSLTYGAGAKKHQSYPAVLSKMTGAYVINKGICGDTSAGVLRRIGEHLKDAEPDTVILCIGTNDLALNVSQEQIKANIDQTILKIKQYTSDVILVSVQDLPLYAELAEKHQIKLLPEVLTYLLAPDWMRSDVVHGNDAAYYALARAIERQL